MNDPRSEIDHTIEVGNVYSDSRTGEKLVLLYEDAHAVLLKDRDGYHRLNTREDFEKQAASGRYEYDPDTEGWGLNETKKGSDDEVPFEDLDNIGDTAAENLRQDGFVTENDIMMATDEELLSVSWVGEKGVDSIREYVG